MKRLLACALALTLVLAGGTAFAYDKDSMDDLSWWGNTGATPEPVRDPVRSGYWWWPTDPASNAGDMEQWGNRGIVYAQWEKPTPPPPPPVPETPPAPVTVTIPQFDNVLFDFDKSNLRPEGKETIQRVINWMQEYPESTVLVEGHTDSIGTDQYNMALGQRRANSVASYMRENGVSDARISTQSYGESQPAVPNTNPANRQLNRRAVFVLSLD